MVFVCTYVLCDSVACCVAVVAVVAVAGSYAKAVKHFSDAISWDTTNHVYFSNRSAAQIYCAKFAQALRDALKCVQLKPKWAKGYSRLGTAQFYLQNYQASFPATLRVWSLWSVWL